LEVQLLVLLLRGIGLSLWLRTEGAGYEQR
jgi:hypothetical protein